MNGNRHTLSRADVRGRVEGFDIANAMIRTRKAQACWSRSALSDRRRMLRKLRDLMAKHAVELATASSKDRARPAIESLTAEVLPLLEACRFLERNLESVLAAKAVGERHRPLWLQGTSSIIVREPFGVILIIGPGNYPLLMPGVQLLQAIAAGNAVVLKPGTGGTASAKALITLIREAGFDQDLCVLLPETIDAAREAIARRPDKVIFTGSSAIGKQILSQLAESCIPSTMELSGCDAAIIREDADLELAASSLTFGLTLNDGATCIAPRRVFVSASVATSLEQILREKIEGVLQSGAYFTSSRASQLAERFSASLLSGIAEATSKGAQMIHGNIQKKRSIICPVVVSNVPRDSILLQEDHFAPLVSIVYVHSDEEAIELANDHDLGLSASVFTRDLDAAQKIAHALNVGMVTINDLIIPAADPRLPISGRKQSGSGATQGAEGLLDMTAPKTITINRALRRHAHTPLRETDSSIIAAFAQLSHVSGMRARAGAALRLFEQLKSYKSQTKKQR